MCVCAARTTQPWHVDTGTSIRGPFEAIVKAHTHAMWIITPVSLLPTTCLANRACDQPQQQRGVTASRCACVETREVWRPGSWLHRQSCTLRTTTSTHDVGPVSETLPGQPTEAAVWGLLPHNPNASQPRVCQHVWEDVPLHLESNQQRIEQVRI